MTINSKGIRERLGLTVIQWAKALNVSSPTVTRWEEGSTDPAGLHAEVMLGIQLALDRGADPIRTGQLVALGIGALIHGELLRRAAPVTA